MDFHTSRSTTFDVQRHALAEHLHALCEARSVDTNLAERIIIALDLLDARRFDKIQRETLERFPEDGRYNTYLDFCQHICKATSLYIRLIERKHAMVRRQPRGTERYSILEVDQVPSLSCAMHWVITRSAWTSLDVMKMIR